MFHLHLLSDHDNYSSDTVTIINKIVIVISRLVKIWWLQFIPYQASIFTISALLHCLPLFIWFPFSSPSSYLFYLFSFSLRLQGVTVTTSIMKEWQIRRWEERHSKQGVKEGLLIDKVIQIQTTRPCTYGLQAYVLLMLCVMSRKDSTARNARSQVSSTPL